MRCDTDGKKFYFFPSCVKLSGNKEIRGIKKSFSIVKPRKKNSCMKQSEKIKHSQEEKNQT